MPILLLSVAVLVIGAGDDSERQEAQVLVNAIESIQRQLEDFRCEYEGNTRYEGKLAKDNTVDENGVFESYSGRFIWKQGGDTHIESWHRDSRNPIARQGIVVRPSEQRAEQYRCFNDSPLGAATITDPKRVQTSFSSMGMIFLIDKLKREVADPDLIPSVSDDQLDGRPVKLLTIGIKGVPQSLLFRYWIDLRRSGHVVCQEAYASGKAMVRRLEIELAPFKIDNVNFWMPVSGNAVGYMAQIDKRPAVMKEPQSFEVIRVVNGTMEFNKKPGPEAFNIRYKLGTPISDNLRNWSTSTDSRRLTRIPLKRKRRICSRSNSLMPSSSTRN